GVRAGGKVQLEGAPRSRLGLDAGYDGRSLFHWHTLVRSQHRIDRGAILQCFPTLWESPKYSLGRRTVDESSYRVGMGDRLPAELVTNTARASAVGRPSGRGIFSKTTGCDRCSSSRHLSTSPKLSREPQVAAKRLCYS